MDELREAGGGDSECEPRYQSALMQVYGRFMIAGNSHGPSYFTSDQAWLQLTDMLLGQMRTTSNKVISVHGNIISGRHPGIADVQVLAVVFGCMLQIKYMQINSWPIYFYSA